MFEYAIEVLENKIIDVSKMMVDGIHYSINTQLLKEREELSTAIKILQKQGE